MSGRALPHWPRLLGAELASRYVGVSPTKFYRLVEEGHISQPKLSGGSVHWDIRDLDDYVDALPKRGEPANDGWAGAAL